MKAGKTHFWLRLSSVLWLLMGIAPLFAQSQRAERVKPPFPSMRFSRHFHNEEAIQALGANLPTVASWYGKSTEEMARLLRHDRNLWVSPTGRLMYTCEMETPSDGRRGSGNRRHPGSCRQFPAGSDFQTAQSSGIQENHLSGFQRTARFQALHGMQAITAEPASSPLHLIWIALPAHSARRNFR